MRQLFIDSRDRISGTSTDFVIELPETLVIEGSNHRARIDNLRIPLTIPAIRTGVTTPSLCKSAVRRVPP